MPDDGVELTHSTRITMALAEWITNGSRGRLLALAHELDCPILSLTQKPEESFTSENAISKAWANVLRMYCTTDEHSLDTELYLISGLLQNNRWRSLLASDDDAYAFTSMLARYSMRSERNMTRSVSANAGSMHDVVRAQLHTMLATWLGEAYLVEHFDTRAFASALFGSAWCSIVIDRRADADFLDALIDATRPPFLPGVLLADRVFIGASLPNDLDCNA